MKNSIISSAIAIAMLATSITYTMENEEDEYQYSTSSQRRVQYDPSEDPRVQEYVPLSEQRGNNPVTPQQTQQFQQQQQNQMNPGAQQRNAPWYKPWKK
jgi:hypothetical protein